MFQQLSHICLGTLKGVFEPTWHPSRVFNVASYVTYSLNFKDIIEDITLGVSVLGHMEDQLTQTLIFS